MTRALLIFNPAASRADPEVVRAVCRVFGRAGWLVDVAGTTRSGDAERLARQGVEDRVDAVVVLGGDGTAMQAVRGVVGHDVPVGIIPVGTGNLLAGNLGLPRKPELAARVIVEGSPRRIDLGRVERDDGIHYFAVACGAGLDATLMAGTSGRSKRRWGMAAYAATLWGALPTLRPVPHRVTVDDTTLHTDAVSVLVANCGEIIPHVMRLRDGIVPDDGLLDVVILRATSVVDGVAVIGRLIAGRTQGSKRIRYARGRRVTVEADMPRPVELDGEMAGETPFTAEVQEGAIQLFVPRPR